MNWDLITSLGDDEMNVDALTNMNNSRQSAQTERQEQIRQMPETIEQENKETKTETAVAIETYRPIESVTESINPNALRFRVKDEYVQALIVNPKGEIVKTIPPSDLRDLMKENAIPTIGNMLDTKV